MIILLVIPQYPRDDCLFPVTAKMIWDAAVGTVDEEAPVINGKKPDKVNSNICYFFLDRPICYFQWWITVSISRGIQIRLVGRNLRTCTDDRCVRFHLDDGTSGLKHL
jgi:hypothetical protein